MLIKLKRKYTDISGCWPVGGCGQMPCRCIAR